MGRWSEMKVKVMYVDLFRLQLRSPIGVARRYWTCAICMYGRNYKNASREAVD